MASVPVTQTPVAQSAETLEERFRRLATAWRQVAPSHPHSPLQYDHPVYQEILGLGQAVVPLLLRALVEYPRDWFWALHVLTGADPVGPEERGNLTGMREAWLRWGREKGYLSQTNEPRAVTLPHPQPLDSRGWEKEFGSPPPDCLEKKFQQLAAIWRAETSYLSSSTAIVNHPAYQEIIHMGPPVVPLLLRDLEREPARWFSALHALTGANPMEPADRGKVAQIAEAWLRWGRANGYTW